MQHPKGLSKRDSASQSSWRFLSSLLSKALRLFIPWQSSDLL
jgi:hypothetical protein